MCFQFLKKSVLKRLDRTVYVYSDVIEGEKTAM